MKTRQSPAATGAHPHLRRPWLALGILAAAMIAICLIAVRVSALVIPAPAAANPTRAATNPSPAAAKLARATANPSAAAAKLDVLPFPGTPDAPPQAQIHFPSLAPSQLRSVTVTGSRSGLHGGHLTAVAGNGGTAFLPDRPFQDGEQVLVQAMVSSPAAGTASGATKATDLSFRFTVAAAASPPPGRPAGAIAHAPKVHASFNPAIFTRSFHSAPWLHPPIASVSGRPPDFTQGDIFLDAENSIQAGPMILDPAGRLVWFQPLHRAAAFNVEVQQYQGQSVLTYWQGYVIQGYGIGADVLLNHSYQAVTTVRAAEGLHADLHEFQVTPEGNALISAYEPVYADLRSVGGPKNGTLLDSILQEINISTGQLIWEWHAYGHVHIAESYAGQPQAKPYDFFHLNSIQQLLNGDFLVSARHTFAIYEINPKTGRIVWTLGGKHSSFRMGYGTNFEWQHDARMHPDGTVTVFDDAEGLAQKSENQSRALRIRINLKRHRATLVRQYLNQPPVLSGSQGNVQILPDGNTFVGWGSEPYFSEYDKRGRQRFGGHLQPPLESYRVYRFPWWGQPTGSPSIAVSPTGAGTRAYVSWNGATDVVAWRMLAGATPTALTQVAQVPKASFESRLWAPTIGPYIAVQALSRTGQVLATTPVVTR